MPLRKLGALATTFALLAPTRLTKAQAPIRIEASSRPPTR